LDRGYRSPDAPSLRPFVVPPLPDCSPSGAGREASSIVAPAASYHSKLEGGAEWFKPSERPPRWDLDVQLALISTLRAVPTKPDAGRVRPGSAMVACAAPWSFDAPRRPFTGASAHGVRRSFGPDECASERRDRILCRGLLSRRVVAPNHVLKRTVSASYAAVSSRPGSPRQTTPRTQSFRAVLHTSCPPFR
jgi:hypothetical protein